MRNHALKTLMKEPAMGPAVRQRAAQLTGRAQPDHRLHQAVLVLAAPMVVVLKYFVGSCPTMGR